MKQCHDPGREKSLNTNYIFLGILGTPVMTLSKNLGRDHDPVMTPNTIILHLKPSNPN